MKTNKLTLTKGFSLVELLVVIAVIAIIAAIAIPNIANITGQATQAKNQRNAQSLASVSAAARAAGYSADVANKGAWFDNLTASNGAGVPVVAGTTTNMFGVSGIATAEKSAILPYLGLSGSGSNSVLLYVQTGGQGE